MKHVPGKFKHQLLHETGTFILAMMFAATISGFASFLVDIAIVAITGSSAPPFVYGFAGTLAFYLSAVTLTIRK